MFVIELRLIDIRKNRTTFTRNNGAWDYDVMKDNGAWDYDVMKDNGACNERLTMM